MNKLIFDNERKIEKFDFDNCIKYKNYKMASAVRALNVANDITKAYFKEEKALSKEDYVLRLYALLQGLFVSIDSLYCLGEAITGNKDVVNINNNPTLRTLKYVRNDVVGHPADRIINSKVPAYCILEHESITKESFLYHIYTVEGVKERIIDINDLVTSYYKEVNLALDELYKIYKKYASTTPLKDSIKNVLDKYYRSGHFMNELNSFMDKYKEIYPTGKKESHRILWRYDLILRLLSVSNQDEDILDLIHYCIGIELNKIYRLIYGTDYNHRVDFNLPKMVISVYRFFNRNPEYISYIPYLKDSDNPIYYDVLKKLYEAASLKKLEGAIEYLGFILTLYKGNQMDLVYAVTLPILEYRKK